METARNPTFHFEVVFYVNGRSSNNPGVLSRHLRNSAAQEDRANSGIGRINAFLRFPSSRARFMEYGYRLLQGNLKFKAVYRGIVKFREYSQSSVRIRQKKNIGAAIFAKCCRDFTAVCITLTQISTINESSEKQIAFDLF